MSSGSAAGADLSSDRLDARRRDVEAAVKAWKRQLIDLGGRNQLLYYRDLRVGTLDVGEADPDGLRDLLSGRPVKISQLFPLPVLADRLKRARAIRNKAREALEERGIATCYLTYGMATWTSTTSAATPAAPVLLREANLAGAGAAEDDYQITVAGVPELNPTLLHLLREQYGLRVEIPALDEDEQDGDAWPELLIGHVADVASQVPGFHIVRRRILGNFSYAKLPMVTDLETNLDALVEHDVVAAMAGNSEARAALAATGSTVHIDDPDRTPPADEYLVLDADSSQNYAINAAVAGQSLVIAGPPGTGKSQTIGNLVASMVARGRSVLFVAEKRAAIEAVLRRLHHVGLDDLILDLHGRSHSRRALANNLATSLEAAARTPHSDQRELQQRIVSRRDKLNAHDSSMHEQRAPWGISVFDAQCAVIGLVQKYDTAIDTATRLRGSDLTRMSADHLHTAISEIRELAALGGLSLTAESSLWSGATVQSPEQAESALDTVSRLESATIPRATGVLQNVLDEAGLHTPEAVADWVGALDLIGRVAKVLDRVVPEVFEAPLDEMIFTLSDAQWRKANPLSRGSALGWGARRRLKKNARHLWHGPAKPSRQTLRGILIDANLIREQWSQHTVDGGLPRLPGMLTEASGCLDQLMRELAAVGAYVSTVTFPELTVEQLPTTIRRLSTDASTLRKIPRINGLTSHLNRLGLDPLLNELRARGIGDPDTVGDALRLCWHRSVLEHIGFADPNIAGFTATMQDDDASAFQAADVSHISHTPARVRRGSVEHLVGICSQFTDQDALVRTQANRKRGHLPLRSLLSSAPGVLTALKPCWAMSPLTVSQLLPADRPYFDVIVFDEASQIMPADAVPAILRAKQVIVAGDKHQLPPTSFFATASDGDDDGEEGAVRDDGSINLSTASGYESILDVLSSILGAGRVRSLNWHYRSKDERLIAFSNAHVYDKNLRTFPGVAGEHCLEHILVDRPRAAVDQDQSVTAEVERVVDLILRHAQCRADRSLGVITMGVKHADRIDLALRAALRDRAELHDFFGESKEEPFFVKNLERVQGDERDAIILSIGYGKTPDGRLLYRFGPLLQEGGYRRLNVAVTRAREHMTVVSSFSHLDMDPSRTSAKGVAMLREYLQFVASGGTNLGDSVREKPALNPFEVSVRDRLAAAGIPVVPQYGVAGYWLDFAAQHPREPGRMVLAIEADGATYHSSPTARDRDRLRQEQLERLGWSFHRIWSTDWFTDSDSCVAKVCSAYEHAVEAADAAAAAQRAAVVVGNDIRSEAGNASSAEFEPKPLAARVPARNPSQCPVEAGYAITEYSTSELVRVLRWIESDTLLRTNEQLLKEFMSALGFRRRGSRIVAAFENALKKRVELQ